MKQLRGFKYRLYPTSAQRLELAQTFGCTRYVYNWALALRTSSYYQENKPLSYTDTSNALTKLKQDPEKSWLKAVSSVPLQQGLRHLNTAFKNFFEGRNKYPKFKQKNNRQSATYARSAFTWKDGKLTLAKMKQPLKIKWSRYFTGEPRSITISKDPSNRYFVSFLVEEELEQWNKVEGKIGIDLGIKDVVVGSNGFTSGNPKHASKYQGRLKTLQRRLAKKKKGSNNRYKARLKVAKLYAKIADCGWGEALRQFQYKCKWHDRELGAIDRWFPSSKRCYPCGHILDKLPLEIREWVCPSCNSNNQRDKNAAKNILAVGQTVFACGSGTGGEVDLLSLAIQG